MCNKISAYNEDYPNIHFHQINIRIKRKKSSNDWLLNSAKAMDVDIDEDLYPFVAIMLLNTLLSTNRKITTYIRHNSCSIHGFLR